MAKYTMQEIIVSEVNGDPLVKEVEDFAEATWYLIEDMHATVSKKFGLAFLRDWLNLDRDSGKVQEVRMVDRGITWLATYDPS